MTGISMESFFCGLAVAVIVFTFVYILKSIKKKLLNYVNKENRK